MAGRREITRGIILILKLSRRSHVALAPGPALIEGVRANFRWLAVYSCSIRSQYLILVREYVERATLDEGLKSTSLTYEGFLVRMLLLYLPIALLSYTVVLSVYSLIVGYRKRQVTSSIAEWSTNRYCLTK